MKNTRVKFVNLPKFKLSGDLWSVKYVDYKHADKVKKFFKQGYLSWNRRWFQ